uniref:G-protein alpha subunit n=1 Tax=Rhabditophanes sp. KR3021 TaxID=114890 RepID=A0AC35U3M2_9BILA
MGNICGVEKNNKLSPLQVAVPVAKTEDEQNNNEDLQSNSNQTITAKNILKNQEESENDSALRILLLGSPESGKSTLMEQIRLLYNQEFKENELYQRKSFLYNNILESMRCILNHMKEHSISFGSEANQAKADIILDDFENIYGPFNAREYDCLESLWSDENVIQTYQMRARYNLNDSAGYFFDSLKRINDINFKPTPQDLIMAYSPTIGIQTLIFTAKHKSYQLIEYAGNKFDATKLKDIYEGIDAVFFCLAISEYDQIPISDPEITKLQFSLKMLDKVCECSRDQQVPLFVFLNETDVFQEKLDISPLGVHFDDYSGLTAKDAMLFMHELVEERCAMHGLKDLHSEYLCTFININESRQMLDKIFKKLKKL